MVTISVSFQKTSLLRFAQHLHNAYSLVATKTAQTKKKRQSASGTTCTNLIQCFPPRSFDSISESLAWSAWFFICSSCGFHSEGTGRDHTQQIVALFFGSHILTPLALPSCHTTMLQTNQEKTGSYAEIICSRKLNKTRTKSNIFRQFAVFCAQALIL